MNVEAPIVCQAKSNFAFRVSKKSPSVQDGGGTLTVIAGDSVTDPIAWDADYTYYVTFVGDNVKGQVHTVSVSDPTGDCGGAFVNPDQAMGTDTEIQEVVVKADKALSAGGYKLEFTNAGGSQTSTCIAYNEDAAGVKSILESMDNIDKVHVTRSQDSTKAPNGYVYLIFFYGNGVSGNVAGLPLAVRISKRMRMGF